MLIKVHSTKLHLVTDCDGCADFRISEALVRDPLVYCYYSKLSLKQQLPTSRSELVVIELYWDQSKAVVLDPL